MRVSWPHYDIDEPRRLAAVGLGAIACDKYQTVAMAAIIQGKPEALRRIRSLADPRRAFAPALHVPAWLEEQGFAQDWVWGGYNCPVRARLRQGAFVWKVRSTFSLWPNTS